MSYSFHETTITILFKICMWSQDIHSEIIFYMPESCITTLINTLSLIDNDIVHKFSNMTRIWKRKSCSKQDKKHGMPIFRLQVHVLPNFFSLPPSAQSSSYM